MNADLAGALASAGAASSVVIDHAAWRALAVGESALAFRGLFVSGDFVFGLFEYHGVPVLLRTGLVERTYPSIASGFPAAAWFERLAGEMAGVFADGAVDRRPAVVHAQAGTDAAWPRFSAVAGEGVYQIGDGPVGAGMIAWPAHRRFSMAGQRIVGIEHRFGYTHRGVAALMRGKSPRVAARFAARIAGDATVAHAVAFARAAEAASGLAVPVRATVLREIMLAIERVTTDVAAISSAVALAGDHRLATRLAQTREMIASTVVEVFGHRLMMDVVVPGGLAVDFRDEARAVLLDALDCAAGATRMMSWGRVQRDLGAAGALVRVRAGSVRALVAVVRKAIAVLPDDGIAQALPAATGMGLGAAESARGVVYHWLDLDDGQIRDCFAVDPSARLVPSLEAELIGLDFEQGAMLAACYGLSVSAIDG